jgi:cytochrome c553
LRQAVRAGLAACAAAWLCGAALAQARADEVRARKIIGGVCFVCHGMEGESAGEASPRLAGQHAKYLSGK